MHQQPHAYEPCLPQSPQTHRATIADAFQQSLALGSSKEREPLRLQPHKWVAIQRVHQMGLP